MIAGNLYAYAQQVALALSQRKWRLSVAESCTGGGLFYVLTDVPGSSQWLTRGYITYEDAAKIQDLGVDAALIEQDGAVSPAVAEQMARGALAKTGADIAVSITGVAGPSGGSISKPVGFVFSYIAMRTGPVIHWGKQFSGGRSNVRALAIECALQQLLIATREPQ